MFLSLLLRSSTFHLIWASFFELTGIPGDGRCLFRAVAHGSSLRCGNGPLNESQQRDLADDLRNKVHVEATYFSIIRHKDATQ